MVTFRRVSRQLQQGRVEWHNRAFTTTGLLRIFFTKEGWTTTAPWQFVHNGGYGQFVERRTNLRRFVDLSKDLHARRTQWRHNRINEWIQDERHEAEAALEVHSPEALHHQFDLINLKLTRDQTKISGDYRAALLCKCCSVRCLASRQQC